MKTYNTLFEAMLEAGKTCREWESPRKPGVVINPEELSEIAAINDMNYPLETNAMQYAAFPDGELCLVNFETRVVCLLFRPVKAQETEQEPVKARWHFCPNCGAKILEDAHFCEMCGNKID